MNPNFEFKIISEPFQGSEEWLELRKTKITATDSRSVMGIDPWKTKSQLYDEKVNGAKNNFSTNPYMERGLRLEDQARRLFEQEYKIDLPKKTVIRGWCLASVDGLSKCGEVLLEIKCPGGKDHETALKGKVPEKYIPQLQFQMYVCAVDFMYYYSFDGIDGVTVRVERDNAYIDEMLEKCWIFYQCILNKTSPELGENEFVQRDDDMWMHYASQYKRIDETLKNLEKEKETIRNHLIYLSMSQNTKGSGISLQKVSRMGNVDYSKIEVLKSIDLDQYRKPSTNAWRITSE